jgi:hypothetical protein
MAEGYDISIPSIQITAWIPILDSFPEAAFRAENRSLLPVLGLHRSVQALFFCLTNLSLVRSFQVFEGFFVSFCMLD